MAKSLAPGNAIRSDKNTYIIRSVLGSGGFGITYSATYSAVINGLPVKVVVAIKEFFMSMNCERDSLTGIVTVSNTARERTEAAMKDFVGEANRLKSISGAHKNIIRVSEVFTANNTAYYVMEFVEGTSLDTYVKTHGPLTEAQTVTIMKPIIEATAFLHRNRITHLDIKPANIMMSTDADAGTRPVLIDFGLSKHYDEDGQATSTINTMGHSEGYSPIEQYTGIRSFSPASDVYSLGATLFFCLTGQRPPVASELNIADIDAQLAKKDVSPGLRHAICNALHLRIADRPADASALLAGIQSPAKTVDIKIEPVNVDLAATRILDVTPQISEPKTPAHTAPTPQKPKTEPIYFDDEDELPKKNHKWLWITLAIVLIAVIGVAGFYYFMLQNKRASFEPGTSYEFTTTGTTSYVDTTFVYHNIIVPEMRSDSHNYYLWCIKTVDGYWAPITYARLAQERSNNPFGLYFEPNSCISWYRGDDSNNVGFSLTAERVEGNELIITTGQDENPNVAEAIFGHQTEFNAHQSHFTADNGLLGGTTWISRTSNKENVLQFSDIIVNMYYTDLYDGYSNAKGTPFIAYRQDGLIKVCFVSGDNPFTEVVAGYVDGDKMYLHRTGICYNDSTPVIEFDRYYGEYNPSPNLPAPAEGEVAAAAEVAPAAEAEAAPAAETEAAPAANVGPTYFDYNETYGADTEGNFYFYDRTTGIEWWYEAATNRWHLVSESAAAY